MKKADAKSIAAQKRPTPVTDLGAADAAAQQAAAVEALARSMPYNANKSKEFGRDKAISPAAGQTLASTSELATELTSASTLSECNQSAKTRTTRTR
jgi:catalase